MAQKTIESVFRPTPPQETFLRSSAKIRAFGGAMAGGKSRTLCEDKFQEALDYPGIRIVIAREAHTSIIETTRKTMLEQVIPSAVIARAKQSGGEDYIELWNGSRIHFIGLDDPYRWYSAEIGSIAFDEAQEIPEDTIVRLLTRLRQPGMPHRATFAFNPENPGHWLQQWFILGAEQTEHGYRKPKLVATGATIGSLGDAEFVFSKATDNPYLPEGYIEQTLAGLPDHLRRRYLEGMWEFISGLCYFDEAALMFYEELARGTKPLMQGTTTGDVVMDAQLRRQGMDAKTAGIQVKQGSGPLMVWRRPVKDHRYVMAIDVSSGGSYDYSAIQVVDVEGFEQVAEWQGKADPDQVAQEAYRIGRIFNNALAVPEITGGWGFSVEQEMRRLRYPRMYTEQVRNKVSRQITDRVGWNTTQMSRQLMLDTLERMLREREFGLYSLRTVMELGTFVYTQKKDLALGRAEAQPGCNDDLVMALAIAVTVIDTRPKQLRGPGKPRKKYTHWLSLGNEPAVA